MKKPTLLCILDGWGERAETEDNAIAQANTPNWDRLKGSYPFGLLDASEGAVGLPQGQMGNSEVGHMNIGAGRVVMQDLPRIDAAIVDGSLAKNPELIKFINTLKTSGGTCHLLGLLSDGGVHSHQAHMAALANIIADSGVPVAVHAFLDGRDTPPVSALNYIEQFRQAIAPNKEKISFATVMGRYYAMDRDNRWDRIEAAYRTMVNYSGNWTNAAENVPGLAYGISCKSDEFVPPSVVDEFDRIKDGDGLLMANFRADRARQMLHALLDKNFTGFVRYRPIENSFTRLIEPMARALFRCCKKTFWGFRRKGRIHFAATLGMVEYSEKLNPLIPALFRPQTLSNNLGEWAAAKGLTQLRIAETEKYAHVTFFFNGGREEPYAGEDRILVPSPKVATYDLQPEMSAGEVTDKLVAAIESGKYDLIVVNYANTDMVGHSGDLEAAKKAVEAVDACLGRLDAAIAKVGGAMLITADHGNAECLHDHDTGQAHTAHTLNLVPCIIIGEAYKTAQKNLGQGILADIAPTICAMMHLTPPPEMTGRNLLQHTP